MRKYLKAITSTPATRKDAALEWGTAAGADEPLRQSRPMDMVAIMLGIISNH